MPFADSSAAIYACVNRKSGTMGAIANTAKCRRGESKLSWNTEGPADKLARQVNRAKKGLKASRDSRAKKGREVKKDLRRRRSSRARGRA
jgi:hypothetical protein